MELHDYAASRMVRLAVETIMAVSRSYCSIRVAGFCIRLQADHFGSGLAYYPTAPHDPHIYTHLRQGSQAFNQRSLAIPFLSGWDHILELFSKNLTKTSTTFVSNAPLLGKVYFHRLAIPISIAISNLITLGIQLSIFLVCFAFQYLRGSNAHFTRWILLTPFFLLTLAGYGLGAGIIVSALTTRYRDLANLVTFGVTLAMYGTPVIYPLSVVPPQYRWLMQLNPLAVLMEGFRLAFLGVGSVNMAQLVVSFGMMLVVLVVGLMLFSHVERIFMDTI